MSNDDAKQRPIIEIAVEPKSRADQEKLGAALAELATEDPSFRVSTDQESGQTILKGVSESHLDEKVERLKHIGIDANIGAPQVAFRETVTRRVEHSYTHKRKDRGKGQFAAVTLVVEPNEPDKGYVFKSEIVSGAVPKEYIHGVEKGLKSVLSSGVSLASPLSTSRFISSTANTTTPTRRRWPSKSQRAPVSVKRCRRASRSCSSRS